MSILAKPFPGLFVLLISLSACGLSTTGITEGPAVSTSSEASNPADPTTSVTSTAPPTSEGPNWGPSDTSTTESGETSSSSDLDSSGSTISTTGEVGPACGNGILEGDEECDDGLPVDARCDADCTFSECGDNLLNTAAGEACDDGNLSPGDTCSESCTDTRIEDVRLGGYHACALFKTGAVRCWGNNSYGQLQRGDRENIALTIPAEELDTDGLLMDALAAGAWHTCRRSTMGNVYCWGGSLGDGYNASAPPDLLPRPKKLLPGGSGVTAIANAGRHSCAIVSSKQVACWGYSDYGQIGANTTNATMQPLLAIGIEDADALALGEGHTCVLQSQDSTVRCWGRNNQGQLGLGHKKSVGRTPAESEVDLPMPPPAVDLGGGIVKQISAGDDFTCALLEAGQVRCWGSNDRGQLGNGIPFTSVGDGDGEMGMNLNPVILGPDEKVKEIATGPQHACALLDTGNVKCWGRADTGALGYGNTVDIDHVEAMNSLVPLDLAGEKVLHIRANSAYSYDHGGSTCAIFENGTLRCWGYNGGGMLGFKEADYPNIGDDEPVLAVDPVPF